MINTMNRTTAYFGESLKRKREGKQISLRELARREVSVSFLCNVKNNRRAPLTEERLATLTGVLNLSEAEEAEMCDIVGHQKGLLAPDLNPYVNDRLYVNATLRIARNLEVNEEYWKRFVEELTREEIREKETPWPSNQSPSQRMTPSFHSQRSNSLQRA